MQSFVDHGKVLVFILKAMGATEGYLAEPWHDQIAVMKSS